MLTFGLIIGVGFLKNSSYKEPIINKADATTGLVRGTALYKELDSDPSSSYNASYYLELSSLSPTPYSGSRLDENINGDNLTVTIGESVASKKWHAVYVPYNYTVSIPAYSSITLKLDTSFRSYKDSQSGSSDHVAEFLFMGTANSSIAPRLQCEKDMASYKSTFANFNIVDNVEAVRVNSNSYGSVNSGSLSFTSSELVNDTNTAISRVLRFAVFGYIETSSYNHTWYSYFSVSISQTSKSYEAYIVPKLSAAKIMYTSLYTALANVTDECKLYLLKNVTGAGAIIGQDTPITFDIDLGGYTWARNTSGASLFNIKDGNTITISNGTLLMSDGTVCVAYVGLSANLTLNQVTVRNNGAAGYGVDMTTGSTLNLFGSTIIGGNAAIRLANGSTVRVGGSTLTGGTYSAVLQSSGAVNKIYIGGNCTLNNRIYVDSVSKNNIYVYDTSYGAYTGNNNITFEFGTLPTVSTTFVNTVLNQGIAKIGIYNLPSHLEIYKNTNTTVALRYKTFNVSFGLTNLNRTSGNTASMDANYVVTLTPTDATLYALPDTITVTNTTSSQTLSSGTQYTYNSSTGVVTVIKDYITGSLEIVATAKLTTKGQVYQFIDSYMHMTDYDASQSGANTGYCKDSSHHYYSTAKAEFNALENTAKTEFMTNSETKIVNAKNRLQAWAIANNEEIAFIDNTYVLNSKVVSPYMGENNSLNYLITVSAIISSLLFVSFVAMAFYKKKQR